MFLYVIHMRFSRRRCLLAAAALLLVTGMSLLLAGCFGGAHQEETMLSTNEQRVAYLQELGWQVSPEPIETLDLQLPEELAPQWGEYLTLQAKQGLPFADCAGQAVRRFTYTVANYPGFPDGVQANLFLPKSRRGSQRSHAALQRQVCAPHAWTIYAKRETRSRVSLFLDHLIRFPRSEIRPRRR